MSERLLVHVAHSAVLVLSGIPTCYFASQRWWPFVMAGAMAFLAQLVGYNSSLRVIDLAQNRTS